LIARAGALAAALAISTLAVARPPPIIDMHLHANTIAHYGGGADLCFNDAPIEFPGIVAPRAITIEAVMRCAQPHAPAANDEAVLRESLAALERHNIVAVTSGPLEQVTRWHAAAPERVIPSISFLADEPRRPKNCAGCSRSGASPCSARSARSIAGSRSTIRSSDRTGRSRRSSTSRWASISVKVRPGGVHIGGIPDYRGALGNPLQLEPVLVRHPKLRLYVMHFGSPFVDEMIALMYSHPQVFIDVAQDNWGFPREHFYGQLKRFVDAGFGKRILFGSDQMIWPGAIDFAIDTIEKAPFLTTAQKRDIFYDNAQRFLKLPARK
jgi:hypothetical protein